MPTQAETPNHEDVVLPEKRVSPDGLSVAIRTIFDDDSPGAVSAWLAVDHRGMATYLTAAQVADWVAV